MKTTATQLIEYGEFQLVPPPLYSNLFGAGVYSAGSQKEKSGLSHKTFGRQSIYKICYNNFGIGTCGSSKPMSDLTK